MSKLVWSALIILTLFVIGFFTVSAIRSQDRSSRLSFSEVQRNLVSGAHLLDVRTKEEIEEGHFVRAELFPLQDIEDGKLPDINKDSKIYLYCRSGNRSSQAKALLEKAGYTDVTDLGGLVDVQRIGGNLTR